MGKALWSAYALSSVWHIIIRQYGRTVDNNNEYLNMIRATRLSNLFQAVNLFSTAKTGRNSLGTTSLPDDHLKQPNKPSSRDQKSSGRRRKRHYTKKSDIPKYTDTETSSATASATCSSAESNQPWKPNPDGAAPEQDDGGDDLGDLFPPAFPEISQLRLRCCILVIVVVSIWAVWEHYFQSRS